MKNVLITGISRGLGLEVARKFLSDNWNVYGVSRSEPKEFSELRASGRFKYHCFDLTNADLIKKNLLDTFLPYDLPIHSVIHNAAIAYDEIATNVQLIPLEEMFKVNVFSPMLINKHLIKNMLLHKTKGSFTYVSSVSTATGYKGLSMYAATKGAMETNFKNLAREWGPKGLRFNCVAPGFMDTEMSSSINDEQRKKIYMRTSLKSETNIESVTGTISFITSDSASNITGQTIRVDNGTI